MCLHQRRRKGVVFLKRMPRLRVTLARRRTYMSFVALVCDVPEVQCVLPQFLIGNFRTLPLASMRALRAQLSPNITLIRQRSAWNDNRLCAAIVRAVAASLGTFAAAYQPILFMDAARCHLKWNVFAACAGLGIWPIVVPSRMTWLLQPLDTHVFASFKRCVQAAILRARCAAAVDDSVLGQLFAALCEAVDSVLLGRTWAHAFASNGFGSGQAGLSTRVLEALSLEAAPEVPDTRPSLAQLQACFPRRARVVVEKVLAAVEHPFAPPILATPAKAAGAAAPLLPPAPPVTRAAAKAAAKAAALAAAPVGVRLAPRKRPAGAV